MEIILNGELRSIENNFSIENLIKESGLIGKYAIEVNRNIIPKSQYASTKIKSGDKIEIVQAIGGG